MQTYLIAVVHLGLDSIYFKVNLLFPAIFFILKNGIYSFAALRV